MIFSLRRALGVAVISCLLAGAALAEEKAGKPAAKEESSGLPAPISGFSDSGTFYVYKDEDRIVTVTFSLKEDGTFENQSILSFAGQSVKTNVKIAPDKVGRWQTITMEAPIGTITVTRDGTKAVRTVKDKPPKTFEIKPDTTLFENFGPALLSPLIRSYDRGKGGKQTFPVQIIPNVLVEGSLERKDQIERSVAGKDLKIRRYAYSVAGIDTTMWVDSQDKVLLVEVPAQHVTYVRDGFEILRKKPESEPLLSKPIHEVKTEANVLIPMRDGVKLSTNIYRPEIADKVPIVLIRTPYKKEMSELQGKFYARRGYAVAIQDCRGRFGSEGVWEPFINEPKDGYDTIEWLAQQPWSKGKIGMIGGSYVGWVQWWAAGQKPPHLVTIIPNVAPPDPFYNIPYEYGAFFLQGAIWWADILETNATGDLSGATIQKIGNKKYNTILRSLPVIELDKKVLGKENRYWRKWIEHPVNDAYWEQANFLDLLAEVNIPAFHQSGWFDGDGIGTKLNYERMRAHNAPDQKLVLGPWGHTDQAARRLGDRDFGPTAIIDLPRDYLRWFDHYLKGIDNGINKEPLVSVFAMGSNRWLHGDVYPLPETRFDKWYLSSSGKANTSRGDGRLKQEAPADEPTDHYTYDPGDPTPDPRVYEEPEDKEKKPQSSEEQEKKVKAYHEQVASSRKDILVYVAEPFKEEYTFVGPVSAVLYASSSARDTDWFMRLMEVDEKGELFGLAEGKIRARFRESLKEPRLLEAGKIYEYKLDLWHTGITIPKGHRVRIEVASAGFPVFSRNLNTGGHNETETNYVSAEQTIYHDKQHPSYLLLPAIPANQKSK